MKKFLLVAVAVMAVLRLSAQTTQVTQQLQKLLVAETAITNLYVDEVDEENLVESAIVSMLEELDPHSSYLNAKEVASSNEKLQGSFEGIGVQFNMVRDTMVVIQPISGGPSEKVGIVAGDRIVSADDTILAGVKMTNTQISSHLRGPKGSTVKLGVVRQGISDVIFFNVVRDQIPINTIDAAFMAAPGIGYIKISNFGAATVSEFETEFDKLSKNGLKSLIVDLQGNGGGYLGAAVGMGNEFLNKDCRIVYTEGRSSRRTVYSAEGNGKYRKGELVILMDEYSASASEIVAGAVQDWDRGTVIGRRSYGKGLVQRPVEFPDGSMIRLTVAKYYTPSGRCIQKPYGDDIDYAHDLETRLLGGELVNADSIHITDTLKYNTLVEKRTVYGGGGIMPDVFVPIDTTRATSWYRQVTARGIVLQVCLDYVDHNRVELMRQYKSFDKFKKGFDAGDELMDRLLKLAEESGIEFVEDEFEKSTKYLTVQLKALVARNLWSLNEYYNILNELNPIYNKALEFLAKKES
ncbi:MAG: S41 family peptidase [Bacteroidaceae bacterium]|nr:S41 family peptidase [Bacteroidaceae bacterium]